MKMLIRFHAVAVCVVALCCGIARADESQPLGAKEQRASALEAEVRRLSGQLEATHRHIQRVEEAAANARVLQLRVEALTHHKKMLEANTKEQVADLHGRFRAAENAWAAKLSKAMERCEAAELIADEVRGNRRLIAETQERLMRGLESDSPEVRAWLRDNLAKLAWPRQQEFNLELTADEKKKHLRKALMKTANSEFVETPLADCVAYWQEYYGVDIVLASELNKDGDRIELNGKVKGPTFADELKSFLDPVGLTYRVERDSRIVIHKK